MPGAQLKEQVTKIGNNRFQSIAYVYQLYLRLSKNTLSERVNFILL